jgi:hypothetical protein
LINTNIAEPIENNAINTPPIAGPVSKIDVPTIRPTKVNINDINFLNIVVAGFVVGIFKTRKPIGAPRIEIKIIIVTTRARDSISLV